MGKFYKKNGGVVTVVVGIITLAALVVGFIFNEGKKSQKQDDMAARLIKMESTLEKLKVHSERTTGIVSDHHPDSAKVYSLPHISKVNNNFSSPRNTKNRPFKPKSSPPTPGKKLVSSRRRSSDDNVSLTGAGLQRLELKYSKRWKHLAQILENETDLSRRLDEIGELEKAGNVLYILGTVRANLKQTNNDNSESKK